MPNPDEVVQDPDVEQPGKVIAPKGPIPPAPVKIPTAIKLRCTRSFIDLVYQDEFGQQANVKLKSSDAPLSIPDTKYNRGVVHPYIKKGLLTILK